MPRGAYEADIARPQQYDERHRQQLLWLIVFKKCVYSVYDAVVVSWADAWEAILTALFLARDSDRLSLCSFNLDIRSL